MDYIEIDDAIGRDGLRLVLTAGVPGPWSESAKGILKVKKMALVSGGLDWVFCENGPC